jgi:hypothetical protein
MAFRRNTRHRRSRKARRATKRKSRIYRRRRRTQTGGFFDPLNRIDGAAVVDYRSLDDDMTDAVRLVTMDEARAFKEDSERA